MILIRGNQTCQLLLVGLLTISPSAQALQFDANAELGVEYTDNVTQAASNEEDDWILHGILSAMIEESTGPLTAHADAIWDHQDYRGSSYGNQDYFGLNAFADWAQVRDRLTWNVRDFFTQTQISTLGTDIPTNTENTNVFTIGPMVRFPVTARQEVFVAPFFSDFYYEQSDLDNSRYGLSAGWSYQMYPTLKVGLEGDATDTKYDNNLNSDYLISGLHAVLSGTRPHSVYRITLGYTTVDRDGLDNQDGPTGSFSWLYNLTGRSSVHAYLASNLTDTSSDFLGAAINPERGDYSNVQASSDIFRDNVMRLEYNRQGSTLNSRVWSEFRDLDYKEELNDRKVQDYGAEISYNVSPLITTGLSGGYIHTKLTDAGRTDKDYVIGGNLGYRLSRKLSCRFNLTYNERDSTLTTADYDEIRVFAGLGYAFRR